MELQNLDKNILYRMCELLVEGDPCRPVDTGVIYKTYADLPGEKIADSIHSLVQKGFLREEQTHQKLFLTSSGHAEIRAFIPERLWPNCETPDGCHVH